MLKQHSYVKQQQNVNDDFDTLHHSFGTLAKFHSFVSVFPGDDFAWLRRRSTQNIPRLPLTSILQLSATIVPVNARSTSNTDTFTFIYSTETTETTTRNDGTT